MGSQSKSYVRLFRDAVQDNEEPQIDMEVLERTVDGLKSIDLPDGTSVACFFDKTDDGAEENWSEPVFIGKAVYSESTINEGAESGDELMSKLKPSFDACKDGTCCPGIAALMQTARDVFVPVQADAKVIHFETKEPLWPQTLSRVAIT